MVSMQNNSLFSRKLVGSVFLVTGCCIGAGMLGLPVLTALAGFMPASFFFILSWLFMLSTSFLLLEVNQTFKKEVNFITMLGATFGNIGKALGWILFSFLFYSLMVAYVVGSGQLFSDFIREYLNLSTPQWTGSLAISLLFGLFLYAGTKTVDIVNQILMIGLVMTYFILVVMGISHVKVEYLTYNNWSLAIYGLPVMIISFGFHNLIPSLSSYLEHDVKKMKFAIFVGSFIPLLIYLVWEWLILGLVPIEGNGGFREALNQGDMATRALYSAVGSSWIVEIAQYFAFFAIVTSFLAVALSFVDFLADGLNIKKKGLNKFGLCLLSLAPPFIFSLIYPRIFLNALNYAGAFGAVILFGILPAAMAWSIRYIKKEKCEPLLPGGKGTLMLIILISTIIIFLQIQST
jgi:tyrosine-specific transport protein